MPDVPDRCAPYQPDLSALLDRELAEPRAAELRAHLEDCAGCRERLAALGRVDAALRAAPMPEVSEALQRRLRERLTGSVPPAPSRRAPRRRRRWLALPAAGIAAAAALALAWLLRSGGEAPDGGSPGAPRLARAPRAAERPAPAPVPPAVARSASPAVEPSATPEPAGDLDAASEEELAVVLSLDTLEDLDLIANLEVVERLAALEGETG